MMKEKKLEMMVSDVIEQKTLRERPWFTDDEQALIDKHPYVCSLGWFVGIAFGPFGYPYVMPAILGLANLAERYSQK